MPNRYWGIGVALGLILIGLISFGLGSYVTALNYPKPDRYQSYTYPGDDEDRARALVDLSKPLEQRTPCENPKGGDESDLCAQWRAANAAEESALWTRLGFFSALFGIAGLYWQIHLTRKAVEDTGEATEAMREANELTENVQRAWVALKAIPQMVSPDQEGIYFRNLVVAENMGATIATHFRVAADLIFQGASETDDALQERAAARVEFWRQDSKSLVTRILAPKEREVADHWGEKYPPELVVHQIFPDMSVCTPILLIAAFYRTTNKPDIQQVSWKTWFISCIQEDGRDTMFVRMGVDYDADHLRVSPQIGMGHKEYPDDSKQGD